ncbi:MAG TPA: DUF72 domain-containing protein [Chthoniobacterales bacterium]|jgi:uncharacterized protein YecE (DUF72 family)
MAARVHIGISGWTYAPWRGVFFPKGLRQSDELAFAARAFSTIEINGTHYSLQKPASFQRWRDETPAGFIFSVKANRYITHLRRLRNVKVPMANFFASGLLALKEKLGPILWQFPPNFRFHAELMEEFLAALPRDTAGAAELAHRHDDHLPARAWLKTDRKRRLRHCIEVRHESFLVPEFFQLLRKNNVAFVFADTAGKWPYVEEITTDFLYLRLHGDEELYVSGYTEKALREWARRIRHWVEGEARKDAPLVLPPRKRAVRDIFVYFDNDAKVKAPRDAKRLAELLGVQAER